MSTRKHPPEDATQQARRIVSTVRGGWVLAIEHCRSMAKKQPSRAARYARSIEAWEKAIAVLDAGVPVVFPNPSTSTRKSKSA